MHKSDATLEALSAALDVFLNFDTVWKQTCEDMRFADLETADILHEIEERKVTDKSKAIDDLELIRDRRRFAKEDQEMLLHVREFVANKKDFIDDFKQLVDSMKKEIVRRESRIYTPRVRKQTVNH